MTPYTPGGVAIYDIEKQTINDVADTAGFAFIASISTFTTTRKGQVAAIVQDQNLDIKIVTYTRGQSKVRVFSEDGTEDTPPEHPIPML